MASKQHIKKTEEIAWRQSTHARLGAFCQTFDRYKRPLVYENKFLLILRQSFNEGAPRHQSPRKDEITGQKKTWKIMRRESITKYLWISCIIKLKREKHIHSDQFVIPAWYGIFWAQRRCVFAYEAREKRRRLVAISTRVKHFYIHL